MSEYWLLDLDRCLLDTPLLTDVLFDTVEANTELRREDLRRARREVEASGGSFDAVTYIEEQLRTQGDTDTFALIERNFSAGAKKVNGLLPGAKGLFDRLTELDIPYGILTYGGDRWQRMKLAATGLNGIPTVITGDPRKGVLISSWQQPDGVFALPDALGGGSYSSLVLVDDKASSFHGLPLEARGYQVILPENALPSQKGELPPHVSRVDTLSDIDV